MTTENGSENKSHAEIWKRVVFVTALFLCIAVLGSVGWIWSYANRKGPDIESESSVVYIPKGSSVRSISGLLAEAGLIYEDEIRFALLAKYHKIAGKFRAGEFRLPTGKTPVEIMHLLVNAKPVQHSVTIPEGLRGEQIAVRFASEGWCDEDEYVKLVSDPDFLAELGFKGLPNLEGYLYPDTYYFTREMRGAELIIRMQVKRFKNVWEELVDEIEPVPNMNETVTLASIVEKETGSAQERPLIAAVFKNRLKKGMRLQSDPTVTYGIKDFSPPITKTHLRTPTPYNTYVIPALPVGPIANPGKDALHAVLHPASTKYLYFVSRNDGTHQFSTNLRDHNRAVRKYQRKKKSKSSKQN